MDFLRNMRRIWWAEAWIKSGVKEWRKMTSSSLSRNPLTSSTVRINTGSGLLQIPLALSQHKTIEFACSSRQMAVPRERPLPNALPESWTINMWWPSCFKDDTNFWYPPVDDIFSIHSNFYTFALFRLSHKFLFWVSCRKNLNTFQNKGKKSSNELWTNFLTLKLTFSIESFLPSKSHG